MGDKTGKIEDNLFSKVNRHAIEIFEKLVEHYVAERTWMRFNCGHEEQETVCYANEAISSFFNIYRREKRMLLCAAATAP